MPINAHSIVRTAPARHDIHWWYGQIDRLLSAPWDRTELNGIQPGRVFDLHDLPAPMRVTLRAAYEVEHWQVREEQRAGRVCFRFIPPCVRLT